MVAGQTVRLLAGGHDRSGTAYTKMSQLRHNSSCIWGVLGFGSFRTAYLHTIFSQLPRVSTTMDTKSQRQKRQDDTLSLLNVAIEAMNLAKEISSMTPAKAIFGSVSVLLAMIRVWPSLLR